MQEKAAILRKNKTFNVAIYKSELVPRIKSIR